MIVLSQVHAFLNNILFNSECLWFLTHGIKLYLLFCELFVFIFVFLFWLDNMFLRFTYAEAC